MTLQNDQLQKPTLFPTLLSLSPHSYFKGISVLSCILMTADHSNRCSNTLCMYEVDLV